MTFLKIWLLCGNLEKFTSMNEEHDQSQSSIWKAVIGRLLRLLRYISQCYKFSIKFSRTICIHFHHSKISAQIMGNIFTPTNSFSCSFMPVIFIGEMTTLLFTLTFEVGYTLRHVFVSFLDTTGRK